MLPCPGFRDPLPAIQQHPPNQPRDLNSFKSTPKPFSFGGKGWIRTSDSVTSNALAGRRLRPLGHFSETLVGCLGFEPSSRKRARFYRPSWSPMPVAPHGPEGEIRTRNKAASQTAASTKLRHLGDWSAGTIRTYTSRPLRAFPLPVGIRRGSLTD